MQKTVLNSRVQHGSESIEYLRVSVVFTSFCSDNRVTLNTRSIKVFSYKEDELRESNYFMLI